MMKHKILLFTGLLLSTFLYSQFPKDAETGKVVYSDVIQIEGLSKEEIYAKSKFWIVSTLKSGDNMVELQGTNSDQIVGTGNLYLDSLSHCKEATLNFKFIVFCKEGRLKYSVENFMLSITGTTRESIYLENLQYPFHNLFKKARKKWSESSEAYIDRKIRQMISNFTVEMNKKKDDDW